MRKTFRRIRWGRWGARLALLAGCSGCSQGPAAPHAGVPQTNIRHVVIVIQENHTFDAYFGRYCTAPAGSAPACTLGPSCCERAPDTEPSGASPVTLTDAANGARDPDHTQACEIAEIDGGAMDRFVAGSACGAPENFAIAPDTVVAAYEGFATIGALADRYFQPIAGQSSSNDMYFAVARWVFTDNALRPAAVGAACTFGTQITYTGQTTLADLLLGAGFSFGFYAEGYAAMQGAAPFCPAAPADCPARADLYPCDYDPGDVPFEYYAQFTDNAAYMKDFDAFSADLAAGALPNVAFVKALGYKTEHPGGGTTISTGAAFVSAVASLVASSVYAQDTLVLVTWDEGGGFFDHVSPPATSTVDGQPYGTRVPLLAIGRFARAGTVSHVTMEHSSIVRFLEFAFLGQVGQLGGRDAVVSNIGSLLDPAQTGVAVPEN